MSPKAKFNFMIDPEELEALRLVEERTGAAIGESIRRAIRAYLEKHPALTKAEVKRIMEG